MGNIHILKTTTGTPNIIHMQISENYVSIYPYMNSLWWRIMWPGVLIYIISHNWLIPLNKYSCHITHVYPSALILYSICRPNISAHTSKKQQTATFIYHAMPMHVSTRNIPLKCHKFCICPNYLTCIYGRSMPNIQATNKVTTINDIASIFCPSLVSTHPLFSIFIISPA